MSRGSSGSGSDGATNAAVAALASIDFCCDAVNAIAPFEFVRLLALRLLKTIQKEKTENFCHCFSLVMKTLN